MKYIVIVLLFFIFISLIIITVLINKLSKLINTKEKNIEKISNQSYNINKIKNNKKKNRVIIRTETLEAEKFDDIKKNEGWR